MTPNSYFQVLFNIVTNTEMVQIQLTGFLETILDLTLHKCMIILPLNTSLTIVAAVLLDPQNII